MRRCRPRACASPASRRSAPPPSLLRGLPGWLGRIRAPHRLLPEGVRGGQRQQRLGPLLLHVDEEPVPLAGLHDIVAARRLRELVLAAAEVEQRADRLEGVVARVAAAALRVGTAPAAVAIVAAAIEQHRDRGVGRPAEREPADVVLVVAALVDQPADPFVPRRAAVGRALRLVAIVAAGVPAQADRLVDAEPLAVAVAAVHVVAAAVVHQAEAEEVGAALAEVARLVLALAVAEVGEEADPAAEHLAVAEAEAVALRRAVEAARPRVAVDVGPVAIRHVDVIARAIDQRRAARPVAGTLRIGPRRVAIVAGAIEQETDAGERVALRVVVRDVLVVAFEVLQDGNAEAGGALREARPLVAILPLRIDQQRDAARRVGEAGRRCDVAIVAVEVEHHAHERPVRLVDRRRALPRVVAAEVDQQRRAAADRRLAVAEQHDARLVADPDARDHVAAEAIDLAGRARRLRQAAAERRQERRLGEARHALSHLQQPHAIDLARQRLEALEQRVLLDADHRLRGVAEEERLAPLRECGARQLALLRRDVHQHRIERVVAAGEVARQQFEQLLVHHRAAVERRPASRRRDLQPERVEVAQRGAPRIGRCRLRIDGAARLRRVDPRRHAAEQPAQRDAVALREGGLRAVAQLGGDARRAPRLRQRLVHARQPRTAERRIGGAHHAGQVVGDAGELLRETARLRDPLEQEPRGRLLRLLAQRARERADDERREEGGAMAHGGIVGRGTPIRAGRYPPASRLRWLPATDGAQLGVVAPRGAT
ncbi:MAG: LEPR-XLL domain-containing protein [Planctomycetes bacterium]|nr:LEPR-XLL domain-containing protein [Planctomycetota bacterium]